MAIAVAATRQVLADAYKGVGTYVGACTANPGTTSTPAAEASGGSPAYARVATTWSSSTGGVVNGTAVVLNVPPGTYTWGILCSAVSGNNMVDASDTADVVMSLQGTLTATPVFTIT